MNIFEFVIDEMPQRSGYQIKRMAIERTERELGVKLPALGVGVSLSRDKFEGQLKVTVTWQTIEPLRERLRRLVGERVDVNPYEVISLLIDCVVATATEHSCQMDDCLFGNDDIYLTRLLNRLEHKDVDPV